MREQHATNPPGASSLDQLRERIRRDYTYHPPTPDTVPRYREINDLLRGMALRLTDLVPEGRELSQALTHLQAARMWANAGIACNPDRLPVLDPDPPLDAMGFPAPVGL